MIVANWCVSDLCPNGRHVLHQRETRIRIEQLLLFPATPVVCSLPCGCPFIGYARIADDPPSSIRRLAGSTLRDPLNVSSSCEVGGS